jgi:hypothetical protein
MLHTKLHFHSHVDYLQSQALKLLRLFHSSHIFSSLDGLKALYTRIILICSKLEHASVVLNNLTLADFNKLENTQRKFENLCYNRFIQPNSFRNYESMLNDLHFKKLYFRRQNLDTLFLINVSRRTKLILVLLWILLVSVYPLSKLETSPILMSVMSQDLALQQGASRLQTTSANLWTFSINKHLL